MWPATRRPWALIAQGRLLRKLPAVNATQIPVLGPPLSILGEFDKMLRNGVIGQSGDVEPFPLCRKWFVRPR